MNRSITGLNELVFSLRSRQGVTTLRFKFLFWWIFFAVVFTCGYSYSQTDANLSEELGVSRHFSLYPHQAFSLEDFAPDLVFQEDPDHSFDIEKCCDANDLDWLTLESSEVNFGFSTSKFWLKLPLENIGEEGGRWILDLNTRFMNGLDAYFVMEKGVQLIVSDSETTPFSERRIPHRQIVGEFSLAAGEKGFLVIGYWSRGTTALPFAIETELTFYQKWIAEDVRIIAFFSIILFMIVFGLSQFFILKSRVQLSYALCIGSSFLYVFHMDGLSFQYLWPQWPRWNADASLYLGLGLNIFAVIFAREFLHTRQRLPKIDKILLAVLVGTLCALVFSTIVDARGLKKYAFLITTCGIFLCMISGVVAYRNGQKDARFYVLGWASIFLAAAFASISHWIEDLLPVPLTFDVAKVGTFFDAIMFAMAMADQANEVRKQRDQAHERERQLLEQDLEAQKQLNLLENQYQGALSLAQQKSLTLASAGHDLRQPIFALKSAMNQVTARSGADVETISQFRQGFDYIENLIKEYLELPGELKSASHSVISKNEEQVDRLISHHEALEDNKDEVFSMNVILHNINMMFAEDAKRKGLGFSFVACSQKVSAVPVTVMRMLSNLVENAIKYTVSGKVMVGCRRRKQHLEIQVWDTGPGFSDAQKDKYFSAYVRGDHPKTAGLGLGLSIVLQLSQQKNYRLELNAQKGKGSVFKFSVPNAEGL